MVLLTKARKIYEQCNVSINFLFNEFFSLLNNCTCTPGLCEHCEGRICNKKY